MHASLGSFLPGLMGVAFLVPCNWWIDFAPELSEEGLQLAPTVGFPHPDSAYWVGDGFTPDRGNSSEGVAVPADLGPNAYTYTVPTVSAAPTTRRWSSRWA